jgi:hypothetical protein
MTAQPSDHADCPAFMRDGMARLGTEITVSTEPPIVQGPFTIPPFVCPHGVRHWMEPTGEQIAEWVRDGAA